MALYNLLILFLLIPMISCSQVSPIHLGNEGYPESFSIKEELIKTDILKIHLPENRPKNLSIMNPSGKWFIIQSSDDSIEYMPQNKFAKEYTIEFRISKLEGVTWREGKKYLEPVFTEYGEYLIYFADNLETEPENTFNFSKRIHYK